MLDAFCGCGIPTVNIMGVLEIKRDGKNGLAFGSLHIMDLAIGF